MTVSTAANPASKQKAEADRWPLLARATKQTNNSYNQHNLFLTSLSTTANGPFAKQPAFDKERFVAFMCSHGGRSNETPGLNFGLTPTLGSYSPTNHADVVAPYWNYKLTATTKYF